MLTPQFNLKDYFLQVAVLDEISLSLVRACKGFFLSHL